MKLKELSINNKCSDIFEFFKLNFKTIKPQTIRYILFFCITLLFATHTFAQENAKLYFIRTTGFNGSAVPFSAFVDDTMKCRLNNKRYSLHELSPGIHTISTQFASKKSKAKAKRITIDMEAGKTYYVQLIFQVGLFKNNLYCKDVTENSAKTIIVNLKEDQNCN